MANNTEHTSHVPDADDAMVPVFSSLNHDAEMEALAVKGVMESNGIPSILVGPHMLPNLEFQVQVPEHFLEQARKALREARYDGRRAADEAEAATE